MVDSPLQRYAIPNMYQLCHTFDANRVTNIEHHQRSQTATSSNPIVLSFLSTRASLIIALDQYIQSSPAYALPTSNVRNSVFV